MFSKVMSHATGRSSRQAHPIGRNEQAGLGEHIADSTQDVADDAAPRLCGQPTERKLDEIRQESDVGQDLGGLGLTPSSRWASPHPSRRRTLPRMPVVWNRL